MSFNHNKSAIAIALVGALAGASYAAAETTVTPYGKITVTLQSTDDSSLKGKELKSNASRFGLKGKSAITDSLNVFYKLEWQVDVTDKANGSDDNIKARNQFVGLSGGFGEILAGRNDTPLKKAQGKVDLFNDLESDIKNVLHGENRESNIVQYTSPKFAGGFKVKVATTSANQKEKSDQDLTSGHSYAIQYSNDNWFASFAADSDIDSKDSTTNRVTVQYKYENWTFGGLFNYHEALVATDVDFTDPANPIVLTEEFVDEENIVLSVAYKAGKNVFKFQSGMGSELALDGEEFGQFGVDQRFITIGWDRKLSKTTKVFAFYATNQHDNSAGQEVVDDNWLAFGLEHKF